MQLELRRQNILVDDTIQAHVQRQMDFALGQFESWISGVTVHLEDVNGPRGGVDQHCRILVNLKGGKTIKIEDLDVDLTAAINRAADRVSRVVGREVEKRRTKK